MYSIYYHISHNIYEPPVKKNTISEVGPPKRPMGVLRAGAGAGAGAGH